jgi:hypothetical protein
MEVNGQRQSPAALYPPGKNPLGTPSAGGWVGPRAGLDTEVRGKISCLCRGSNLDRPVPRRDTSLLTFKRIILTPQICIIATRCLYVLRYVSPALLSGFSLRRSVLMSVAVTPFEACGTLSGTGTGKVFLQPVISYLVLHTKVLDRPAQLARYQTLGSQLGFHLSGLAFFWIQSKTYCFACDSFCERMNMLCHALLSSEDTAKNLSSQINRSVDKVSSLFLIIFVMSCI